MSDGRVPLCSTAMMASHKIDQVSPVSQSVRGDGEWHGARWGDVQGVEPIRTGHFLLPYKFLVISKVLANFQAPPYSTIT